MKLTERVAMFGPELYTQNERGAIALAPIDFDDLPQAVDPQINEHLTDHFKGFLADLPNQYEWLKDGEDNLHWGIYNRERTRLLGITGLRNLDGSDSPAISRIALFESSSRGRGIGRAAYEAQYGYVRHEVAARHFEHSAANANVGSLRIAQSVGFTAVYGDGLRTTMHLNY